MAYNEKCDPLSNTYDVPVLPPIPGLDGFTLDINFPTLGIELPEGIPEDLLDWIRRLKLNLPGGGVLQETLESFQETISEILAHLLASLQMFLSFYNIILAIIEIIICVINVLLAFSSVRKTIKAIKCLIRKCYPFFIRVALPFMSFLALLLSLLALLLALIEYIIALIKRLIEQLLRNIRRLEDVLRDGNPNSALAIVSKLADLMCLFEHIFVLLGVVNLIIDLIKSKLSKRFKVCNGTDDNNSVLSNDNICAAFLQEPDTQTVVSPETWALRMKGDASGNMWYCNEVYGAPIFPAGLPDTKIRNESVYLNDDSLAEALRFSNMISYKPINESRSFPMFPFSNSITADLQSNMIPYSVDITMNIDPNDGYGARDITIEDTVVLLPTTQAILQVLAGIPIPSTGTYGFLLVSGGKTINDPNGYDGHTIEELLFDNSGLPPSITGSGTNVSYPNITYQVKANYESLVEYGVVNIGCLPSMQQEYAHFDEVYDKPMSVLAVDLPDVGSAISQMEQCVTTLKSGMNVDAINNFDTCMNDILVDLSNQANTSYCQLLDQSIDIYNTSIDLEPDLQFASLPIDLNITPLNTDNGTIADLVGGFGTSVDIDGCLSSNFTATASLGDVSDFTYDGYGNFTAQITSDVPGDGYVEVFYKGEQIPTIISPADIDEQPSIVYTPIEYTFVGLFADGYAQGVLPLSRRDEGDVSRN